MAQFHLFVAMGKTISNNSVQPTAARCPLRGQRWLTSDVMNIGMRWLLAGGLLAIAVSAPAPSAGPRINTVYPPAFERGVVTSLQIVGKELATATDISVPFKAEISKRSTGNTDVCEFSIKPASDTPPGVYPLRLRSQEGISNLRLIAVTSVPVVKRSREIKASGYKNGQPNLEQAQRVEWPVVLTGGRLSRPWRRTR